MTRANQKAENVDDDAGLLAGLQQADSVALKKWYDKYSPYFLQMCEQKGVDESASEELVHDVFLTALRQLPLFLQKSSLKTWMVGIARNKIADYFRKKYAKMAIKKIPLSDFVLNTTDEVTTQTVSDVSLILQKMKQTYAELLQQKYLDGLKVSEIAKRFSRSVKAIESDLFRARKQFVELWNKHI